MAFNPFKTPLGDQLNVGDLQQLVGRVAEGYTVEYKEAFPDRKKIGHSLASFANTYGGWYIVGVRTDNNNVASEVCGYDTFDYPDAISTVRDIARSHIDPTPVLYPQIVALEVNRAVLLVFVPGEQETPFIMKDGRIYRRVYDSSDPIPEANRYAVDRLFEQGRTRRERFRQFCQDDRDFSSDEEDQGWMFFSRHIPKASKNYPRRCQLILWTIYWR
ncbi:MAG: AlbA family DNA-binding domain-containing protein [Thermomicrobiales bacterium]